MKSVLISIRPNWCEKIASRRKTIEVRKSAPKEVPFKAYIYCTNQKINGEILLTFDKKVEGRNRGFRDKGDIPLAGKVIGEFVCDKVVRTCGWRLRGDTQQCAKQTAMEKEFPYLACLTIDEIVDYAGNENGGVIGWHISDLKIYDKPKELSEFNRPCSYAGLCFSCDRATFVGNGDVTCDKAINRPPMSYMFVEELK